MASSSASKKGRLAFIHPDLGLGGAERLIVDAAVGLQSRGYQVIIYTGYHDEKHSFPETTDGTLKVVAVGQWIPRSFLGRFVAPLAYLKMSLIALYITIFCRGERPDLVICDQVSACIPFLKVIPGYPFHKVLFYCHFPDQLLATRESAIKSFYRRPLDFIEEKTTGMADKIVVNSDFTKSVFKETFRSLRVVPDILYPSINSALFDEMMKTKTEVRREGANARHLFLSMNRFEPKKNIALAIRTLKKLRTCLDDDEWSEVHLIVAGGYDPRIQSSVVYLEKLKKIVADEGVADHVTFILSPKDAVKVKLMSMCSALIYTPSNEHFGIVPLEAMYMGKPVIAVNSGGPRETVIDNETGFLCPATEAHFAVAMARIVKEPKLAMTMGRAGKKQFSTNFSFEAFTNRWERCVAELCDMTKVKTG